MREGSIIINCQLARTSWNRDNFFRFSRNFVIEVSPLFQTSPVSTKKKILRLKEYVYFSQFPIKGERKREKKVKEKGTCSRASTKNLALILTRVISFGVPADDPYVLQPLKRISTVDLLS